MLDPGSEAGGLLAPRRPVLSPAPPPLVQEEGDQSGTGGSRRVRARRHGPLLGVCVSRWAPFCRTHTPASPSPPRPLLPLGCPPHSSLMTDPSGKPRGGDQRGEPHPGLCSPPGALALHGPAAWGKALRETGRPLGSPTPPLCKSPCLSATCAPRKDDCLAPQPEQAVLKFWEHKAACPREECLCSPRSPGPGRHPPPWALPQPLPLAALLSSHILLGLPAPILTQVLSITLLSSQSPIFH